MTTGKRSRKSKRKKRTEPKHSRRRQRLTTQTQACDFARRSRRHDFRLGAHSSDSRRECNNCYYRILYGSSPSPLPSLVDRASNSATPAYDFSFFPPRCPPNIHNITITMIRRKWFHEWREDVWLPGGLERTTRQVYSFSGVTFSTYSNVSLSRYPACIMRSTHRKRNQSCKTILHKTCARVSCYYLSTGFGLRGTISWWVSHLICRLSVYSWFFPSDQGTGGNNK